MRIMVMDGQGGGVGRSLLEALKERFPEAELIAVGTNATATANMMKRLEAADEKLLVDDHDDYRQQQLRQAHGDVVAVIKLRRWESSWRMPC